VVKHLESAKKLISTAGDAKVIIIYQGCYRASRVQQVLVRNVLWVQSWSRCTTNLKWPVSILLHQSQVSSSYCSRNYVLAITCRIWLQILKGVNRDHLVSVRTDFYLYDPIVTRTFRNDDRGFSSVFSTIPCASKVEQARPIRTKNQRIAWLSQSR
jgi:hypothetical protein